MKKLLLILTTILILCSCGDSGNTPSEVIDIPNKIEIEATDSDYFANEIPCDSLNWSMKITSDLRFENLKSNKTTMVILSEKTGEQFLKHPRKAKQWNSIDISDLEKGIYYIELSDWTGPVCRNIFVKK
jgi:hypothetical protein